jgi:endonuclease/exonuclease/phosphatase family metal-dependent hydrolase
MKAGIERIRVVTYNVHRCRGLDRRVCPERIVEVLREIDADIVALQEVVSTEGGDPEEDQAAYISCALGMRFFMGRNRRLKRGFLGNLILSRHPLRAACNYNISTKGRERRGCLRVDLEVAGAVPLHVFNAHLGTAYLERRRQVRMLLTSEILNNGGLQGARVVLGDFNEWTRGLATRLLSAQFSSVDIQKHLRRSRTYPGILPLLHLDHIYFDPILTVESLSLHKRRAALIASDHLPLVADFRMPTMG